MARPEAHTTRGTNRPFARVRLPSGDVEAPPITNHHPALRATDCLLRSDDLRREGSQITAFLIDTPAIRNRSNSFRMSTNVISNRHSLGAIVALFFLATLTTLAASPRWQAPTPAPTAKAATPSAPSSAGSTNAKPTAAANASAAVSANLVVVPDLAKRVAQFRKVKMPYDSKGLTSREKQMIDKLVDAAELARLRHHWRQSDPDGLKLYLSLANSTNPRDVLLREYLKINGSRFDLIDDQKPFVGTQPMPPGHGFYPPDLTRSLFDAYVAANPKQKTFCNDPWTVRISCNGAALEAVPYHVAFDEFLAPMAKDLYDAAALSDDPAFAKFLNLRAGALLSDDYYPSDIAWLDLENPKFDVIFAPYETYLDDLLGVKTSYGASILIRNEAEKQKASHIFQKYVPGLAGIAAAHTRRPTLEARQTVADGSDGRCVSRRGFAARLSGRGR